MTLTLTCIFQYTIAHNIAAYSSDANCTLLTAVTSSYIYLISDPPTLDSVPSDGIVTEGDNVTLQCNATGNPVPNITWTKPGGEKAYGETLSLTSIKKEQGGSFSCVASNGGGEVAITSFTLTVHCKYIYQ